MIELLSHFQDEDGRLASLVTELLELDTRLQVRFMLLNDPLDTCQPIASLLLGRGTYTCCCDCKKMHATHLEAVVQNLFSVTA